MEERRRPRDRHPAVGDVAKLLGKSEHDLLIAQRRIEAEFQASYPDHANPCKIMSRIKKIQEELVSLKELCRELLSEKQDLIDKARASLVMQRGSLQRLLASTGLPLMNDSDELLYTDLNKVIDEWTGQVMKLTTDGEVQAADQDINRMLFSAIVRD